jgi:hypothetical protein
MNAERGSEAQNQHVILDEMNTDVKAKRNKVAFVSSVICIAVLAVVSFAMLGFEQHEFLVFDADRTQARREVDRLREFAAKQETANAAVSDELARRDALLISRQQLFEEFSTLTGRHDVDTVITFSLEVSDAYDRAKGRQDWEFEGSALAG